MAVIAGTLADIYVASGAGTAMTTEAMTAGADTVTYQITNLAKRYWDATTPTHVFVGGVEKFAGFGINYGSGQVVFQTAPGGAVTVTGAYLTIAQAGQSKDWSLDIDANTIDVSKFGTVWRTFIQSIHGFTASMGRYYLDNYFINLISNGAPCILVLYTNQAANKRYECFGYLTKDSMKDTATGVLEETITFTGSGATVYYDS